MIYPEADKLEKWGSKYSLVVLAAKRAKQIKSGAPALINTDSRNPLTVALEEIAAGRVQCVVPDNDLPIVVAEQPEVAQLLGALSKERQEEAAEPVALAVVDDEAVLTSDEEEEAVEAELEDEEEEEDEEETEVGLLVVDDDDEEVAALDEEPTALALQPETDDLLSPPEPKPRRGRKRKADVELPDVLDADADTVVPDEEADVISLEDVELQEEEDEHDPYGEEE